MSLAVWVFVLLILKGYPKWAALFSFEPFAVFGLEKNKQIGLNTSLLGYINHY
jgi:hypothetical protein